MTVWKSLGGSNSGIVGNDAHNSGFHRAANEVPVTDYSRRRDPNGADGPFVDWSYACAGDFYHGRKTLLLEKTRILLARLMRGELPMICEFIGQPWADRPVYYWARWNGVATLQQYTGSGHDMWNHISWYRSRVNQQANLWEDEMALSTTGNFVGGVSEAQALRDLWWSSFKGNPIDVEQKALARIELTQQAILTAVAGQTTTEEIKGAINSTAEQLSAKVEEHFTKLQESVANVDESVMERIGAVESPEEIAARLKIVLGDKAESVFRAGLAG